MNTLKLNPNSRYDRKILIGFEGENAVSGVDFNMTSWVEKYGEGSLVLFVIRPGDTVPYPVSLSIVDGIATWIITSIDCAKRGNGAIQLKYTAGTTVKKSYIYVTSCHDALDETSTVPDGYDSWLDTLTDLAAETQANAQTAQASAESAAASARAAEVAKEDVLDALDGYATESWVQEQGYLTEHQSLEGYATEQYVDDAVDTLEQKHDSDISEVNEKLLNAFPVDTATGSVASFSDGAELPLKELTVNIDPVQDFNGYDRPWPAGGGKNLFENKFVTSTINGITATVDEDGVVTLNGTATGNGIFDITTDTVILPSNDSYIVSGGADGGGSNTYRLYFEYYNYTSETWVGLVCSSADAERTITTDQIRNVKIQFFDGVTCNNVVFKPMIRKATETDTTFSPYSNICPISGWSEANVVACGKNLLGGEFLLSNAQHYLPHGTTDEEEEYFSFSSSGTTDIDYRFSTGVTFKEDTQYQFILTIYKTSGTGSNLRINYTNGTYTNVPPVSAVGTKETISVLSAAGKTVLNLSKTNMAGLTRLYYNECGVFEGVLTADDFEPYHGTPIAIDFGQTVYGGVLDVLSGKLTVTDVNIPSYNGETLPSKWISDRDVYSEGATPTTGAQVVYKLSEPIEITLDPHEVSSLLGQNNIYADTGDTSVEYRADPTLYISRKIAEAISALT